FLLRLSWPTGPSPHRPPCYPPCPTIKTRPFHPHERIRFIIAHLFTTVLDWISIGRLGSHEKDLEIMLLRQQLTIVQRRLDKSVRPERIEKLTLAILAAKLKSMTQHPTKQLGHVVRLFQPETVIGWQRELVRRKWRYQRVNAGGRPRTKA